MNRIKYEVVRGRCRPSHMLLLLQDSLCPLFLLLYFSLFSPFLILRAPVCTSAARAAGDSLTLRSPILPFIPSPGLIPSHRYNAAPPPLPPNKKSISHETLAPSLTSKGEKEREDQINGVEEEKRMEAKIDERNEEETYVFGA